jgi:hypothetical protein
VGAGLRAQLYGLGCRRHLCKRSALSPSPPPQPHLYGALQLVQGYMNLKLGVDKVYAEMEEDYDDDIGEVTLEQAIEIIQRNERGRQGMQRAALVKRLRVEEMRQRCVMCDV